MKHFIIVSLKHSTEQEVVFWKADDSGYTSIPWLAGVYTEEKIRGDLGYYNDGTNIPVELTYHELQEAGLLIKPLITKLRDYSKKQMKDLKPIKKSAV
jgi:hypothetical protein